MMNENTNEWVITDPDCLQCCRYTPEWGDRVFELTQINSFPGHVDGVPFYQVAHGHLYLDDYFKDEELEMLVIYGYGDREGFREAYPDLTDIGYDQLLAEMFFETEVQEYSSAEVYNWNLAVEEVQKITGMDLSQYKEKSKSLSQIIQSAEEKTKAGESRESVSPTHQR